MTNEDAELCIELNGLSWINLVINLGVRALLLTED